MDIYFLTMILNWVWYIFSILFVLYRFTSFFSYVYGFLKFVGKLFEGLIFVKNQSYNYINPTFNNNINDDNDDDLLEQGNKTAFQKCKDIWNGLFFSEYNIIPKPLIPLSSTTREHSASFFKPDLRDSSTMTFDSNYFLHTNTLSKNVENENHSKLFNKHLAFYIKDNESIISNVNECNVGVSDFKSVDYSVNEWIDNEKLNEKINKVSLDDSLDEINSFGI